MRNTSSSVFTYGSCNDQALRPCVAAYKIRALGNSLATMFQSRCNFGHWTCRNDSNILRIYSTRLRCNHQRQLIKMRIRFYFHVALWCALFAVFLARSIPILGPAVLENKIGPVDPNHSTDSYLSGLTHVRNGSELFSNLIETVPRAKQLIIFVDAKSFPRQFLV